MSIDKITTLRIEEFKAQQLTKGLNPKTINNHLGTLRTCLKAAEEWLGLSRLPKIKPLKVPPQTFRYLNEREYTTLLEAAKREEYSIYKMLLFSLRTGIRYGELIGLEWQDVNFNNQTVTINRSIVNGITGSPKNNRTRTIPLSADLLEVLLRDKRKEGSIFLRKEIKPFSRFSCYRTLRRLCKENNLRIISWHGLRHSFASQLATNGVSLITIQTLMGHSDLKMVQRYAHLEPITLKEAIKTLEPRKTFSFSSWHNSDTVPDKTKIKALEN